MTTYALVNAAIITNRVTDANGLVWTIKKLNGTDVNWASPPVTVTTPLGSVDFWPNMVTNPPIYDDEGTVAGHPADAGSVIDGTITYTLTNGTLETPVATISNRLLGSAAPPVPPVANGTAPTVSGLQPVGSTLTVDVGQWSGVAPIVYTYQWRRDGANIGSATASTYVTVSADIGKLVTCAVTATDAQPTNATVVSSNSIAVTPIAVANSVAPSISGTPVEGNTLTRVAGTWTGTGAITLTYQWQRNGGNIAGATGTSYILQAADVGTQVRVVETATDSISQTGSANSVALTVTAAGSGPGLAFFLPTASHRTRRAEIVAAHFPGTSQDHEFTGFTAGEVAAMTTQTATSFVDLIARINALGATSQVDFLCAWNGNSASGSAVNGTPASALTPNGAIDYGYTRHTQKILIRPATGFAPALQPPGAGGTGGQAWNGMNFIEFRDVIVDSGRMSFTRNATRPTPACIAFKTCTLRNGEHDNGTIDANPGVRSLHIEDCTYDGNRAGHRACAQYFRAWNNVIVNHRDNDWNLIRGFGGFALQWRAQPWVAGNLVYGPSQTLNLSSGSHFDFFQVSTTAAAGNVNEHDILIEFNIDYANRPYAAGNPQGCFGDDGTATGEWEWMVHNNIIAVGNNYGLHLFDPINDGRKLAIRNTIVRKGSGSGGGTPTDKEPRLRAFTKQAGTGIGTFENRDNIYAVAGTNASTGGIPTAGGEVASNNLDCDPRTSAPVGNRMQDTFAGNGTFGQTNGQWTYDVLDQGQTAAVARQRIRDFFRPIRGPQGSGYASAAGHVGCTDPSLWPTDFRNLA